MINLTTEVVKSMLKLLQNVALLYFILRDGNQRRMENAT